MLTQRERIKNESTFLALSSTPQQENFIPLLWDAAMRTLKGMQLCILSKDVRGLIEEGQGECLLVKELESFSFLLLKINFWIFTILSSIVTVNFTY